LCCSCIGDDKLEYINGLAIFIDILGTQECTQENNFNKLYNINKIFHKELKILNKRQRLCKKFVTSFSDCAYIIYIIDETHEDNSFYMFIQDSLIDLSYTISTILVNDFLCRGGIYLGKLYFEEENNLLFGPAVIEAYKLEENGIMPRIIIDDKLGREFYLKEGEFNVKNFQRIIRKDTFDNRYYLNYLNVFSQFDYLDIDDGLYNEKIPFGDKEYNFDEYYNILLNNSIKKTKEKDDHNIISKHKWQLKYLKQHFNERLHLSD